MDWRCSPCSTERLQAEDRPVRRRFVVARLRVATTQRLLAVAARWLLVATARMLGLPTLLLAVAARLLVATARQLLAHVLVWRARRGRSSNHHLSMPSLQTAR